MPGELKKEKIQFSVYCDRELGERVDQLGKMFGMSRNEMAVFLLESGLKGVQVGERSGLLRFAQKLGALRAAAVVEKAFPESA